MFSYFNDSEPLEGDTQTHLVIYLSSPLSKEVHVSLHVMKVFDCLAKKRIFTKEILSRQIEVPPDEQFIRLSLKMIVNEKYEYTIRSTLP